MYCFFRLDLMTNELLLGSRFLDVLSLDLDQCRRSHVNLLDQVLLADVWTIYIVDNIWLSAIKYLGSFSCSYNFMQVKLFKSWNLFSVEVGDFRYVDKVSQRRRRRCILFSPSFAQLIQSTDRVLRPPSRVDRREWSPTTVVQQQGARKLGQRRQRP